MATLVDVEAAWSDVIASTNLQDPINKANPAALAEEGDAYLVPVTYMKQQC